ncbi:MAG TPA: hypothetical protein VNF99_06270 [Stellaceae bacterium]|nr:hypothetical protein [Stellaceae bacterium]
MAADINARDVLLAEGFKGYLDVYNALAVFESEIQELSRNALNKRLSEIKASFGRPELTAEDISEVADGVEGVVAIGVKIDLPETWGFRFGLKWGQPKADTKLRPAFATCAVRLGSQQRRKSLFQTFASVKQTSRVAVNLRTRAEWPYEVQFDIPLTSPSSSAQFEKRLSDVLAAFLDLTKAIGGLKKAVSR